MNGGPIKTEALPPELALMNEQRYQTGGGGGGGGGSREQASVVPLPQGRAPFCVH